MSNYPADFFGDSLKKLRNEKNMTQEELGERCNCSPSYICLLENNKKSPKMKTIFILAKGLGMNAFELVKVIEENTERPKILLSTASNK